MTTKSKKVSKKSSVNVTGINAKSVTGVKVLPMKTNNTFVQNNSTIGFNTESLKSLSVLAASIMFQAPQFATQTTPQNILGLADLMYKYVIGEVSVNQPEVKAEPDKGTPTT